MVLLPLLAQKYYRSVGTGFSDSCMVVGSDGKEVSDLTYCGTPFSLALSIQGVTNKFRQNLSAYIKTQN